MNLLLSIVFLLLLIAASIWDMLTLRIPNWLTVPGFIIVAILSFLGGKEMLNFFFSALFSFTLLALLSWKLKGRLGMGDVKLSLSISGVLGIYYWLVSLFIASAIGLCAALWIIWESKGGDREKPIPFSPFLSIGAAIAHLMGVKGIDLS